MTGFVIALAVIVVGGLALTIVLPRVLMARRTAKMKGRPAPTPHKGSAKRIKSGAPTILYFSATTCPTCRAQDPLVANIQKRHPGAIHKIDVSINAQVAKAYSVVTVPYFAFIDGGKLVSARVGAQEEATIIEFLSGDEARP